MIYWYGENTLFKKNVFHNAVKSIITIDLLVASGLTNRNKVKNHNGNEIPLKFNSAYEP